MKSFFTTAEIIPKSLLPDEDSRAKLDKSLSHVENPENLLNVGGSLGHYLPDHQVALGSLAANAVTYLNALKPKSVATGPLDSPAPLDRSAQARYNRALDIAQQPLIVLQHAKEGTLIPQDVQTLNTLYPGLHKSIVQKINNELIEQHSAGNKIPYSERTSLSLLIGSPLDSTMTPESLQAIVKSAGIQQQAVAQVQRDRQSKASGTELRQINKVNDLYATPLQRRQITKKP